jgi:hypothetical protein
LLFVSFGMTHNQVVLGSNPSGPNTRNKHLEIKI